MNPQSHWLRGFVVVAVVLLVQDGVCRGLRVDGVRPDFLLGAGIVAALVAGPERGAVLAFGAALVGDLFVNTPFGLSALVASIAAFAAGSIQQSVGAHHRWSIPVLAAAASGAGVGLWAVLGTTVGMVRLLDIRLAVVAVAVASMNAAAALPLAGMMRWAYEETAGRTVQARRYAG